jgi:hypothetical protein
MKEVICITVGTAAASVNMINAGKSCKDDKDKEEVKKLPENLAINVDGADYVKMDDAIKKNFNLCDSFKDVFKFDQKDIGTDVSVFVNDLNTINFIVLVGMKSIVGKQDQSIKNNDTNPLGENDCSVCCIDMNSGVNPLQKNEFKVEADKNVKGKFIITKITPLSPAS